MYKFRIKLFVILTTMLVLSGCGSALWNKKPPPNPVPVGVVAGAATGAAVGAVAGSGFASPMGAFAGAIVGGSIGTMFNKHQQTLVQQLLYNGVYVIRKGDEIMLVLPSDRFFYPDSPNLNPNYYTVLNDVAELLDSIKKINVEVAGYTDNQGSWQRNLGLSKEQAQRVANYLWEKGVNARLLYSEGYGDKDPIASNNTKKGRADNRRIEITLRRIVPPVMV